VSWPTLRHSPYSDFRVRDYHPVSSKIPNHSTTLCMDYSNWAFPISLAATFRISVDFFSSRYLDVSVPWVRLLILCIQIRILCKQSGLPHSDIFGSSLVVSSPKLFADYYVLLRLLPPRHPPYALIHLTI
jgi:hypothetical protein